MDLGLSHVQATIYLNLVKVGEANAKTVAKLSGIARQDIYQAMPTLEHRRLVKKILANPTVYRATPLEKAFTFLLEDKRNQIEQLKKAKTMLVDNLCTAHQPLGIEETAEFVLASELCLFLKNHETLLQETQRTLDIIIVNLEVPFRIVNEWELLKTNLQSHPDLKIRLIVNKPSGDCNILWQPLIGNPSFQIKYVDQQILFGMHIFDSKQLTLQVKRGSILPSLWSNNPNIVGFALTYFESKWEKEES